MNLLTQINQKGLSFKNKFDFEHKARVPFLYSWELFRAPKQGYGVG